MKGAFSTLNDVSGWFLLQNKPYFTLYDGNRKNRQVILRNETMHDIEEAHESLIQNLRQLTSSGGFFTLFVTDKPGANNGFSVKIDVPNPGNASSASIGAINGLGNGTFVPGVGSVSNAVENHIKDRIEAEKKVWEQNKRIEDLEAQIGAPNSIVDRIIGYVESNPTLVNAFIAKIFGSNPIQGNTGAIASSPTQQDELNAKLMEIMGRFESVFGEDTIPTLDKLSNWLINNETMAKNFINNL